MRGYVAVDCLQDGYCLAAGSAPLEYCTYIVTMEEDMIEALSGFPENIVAVACKGHVTREDYETILEPRVDEALEKHKKIRLYYEIGRDFDGIDPGAVWEDFKIGMGHLNRWERIAVVTDVHWIEHTMKAFSFLLPGEMKIFPTSEKAKAREWASAA